MDLSYNNKIKLMEVLGFNNCDNETHSSVANTE